MTTTHLGSYVTLDDGRSAVRFERVYDHPIDRVWTLVTEPAELAHWFPSPKITIDLTPGGTITFAGDPNMPDAQSSGRIIDVDAPRRLVFTWGDEELRFELEPLGEQRTRFTLTDVLQARDAAARNAAGWDVCLSALGARAAGAPAGGAPAGPAVAWEERYEEYIAAGVPSGAPVPGKG